MKIHSQNWHNFYARIALSSNVPLALPSVHATLPQRLFYFDRFHSRRQIAEANRLEWLGGNRSFRPGNLISPLIISSRLVRFIKQ